MSVKSSRPSIPARWVSIDPMRWAAQRWTRADLTLATKAIAQALANAVQSLSQHMKAVIDGLLTAEVFDT